jgi:hypothetical protein
MARKNILLTTFGKKSLEHSGQWRSMAEQTLNNCFKPKQTASNPERQSSPLFNNGKNY